MELTYYGHSCFSVKAGNKNILFDPYITENELAREIKIDDIKADYIFISHGHFDHILDVKRIAENTGAKVIATWEVKDWLNANGVENTHPMNPGGTWTFDFGKVKCVIAQHSSSMPDGSYGGVASGFVLDTPEGKFYYSGDTALTMDMQLIPKWATLDFAVFPIGDDLTMGVDDAIIAAEMVGVKKVMGVHYDTFGYIILDHEAAQRKFSAKGMELLLVPIGNTVSI